MSQTVCTNCGTPAQPGAQFCPRCGMQYGAQTPPPYPPAHTQYGYPPMLSSSGKEKVPAGLLALFLGTLGIHLFYLRQTGWGVVFLLVTVLTCGMGAMITGPISVIQGILYLIANDQEFEQKYVVERRFF